jgi:hypothetical protein
MAARHHQSIENTMTDRTEIHRAIELLDRQHRFIEDGLGAEWELGVYLRSGWRVVRDEQGMGWYADRPPRPSTGGV